MNARIGELLDTIITAAMGLASICLLYTSDAADD